MQTNQLTADLAELLASASTPEFSAMACEAAAFLYDTQVEEFAIRLQNVISDSTIMEDNGEIVGLVAVVLRECLDDYLLDHRIRVSEDAPLWIVTKVGKAVIELPFWQETDAVVDICMTDTPTKDRMADLVKLVCGTETQLMAASLESVDESFLKRLIELVNGGVEDLYESPLDEEQVKRLRQFKLLYHKTLALQMIELGYRIGSPFLSYMNRVMQRLQQMNNQEFGKEAAAFLLMAGDTWFDPLAGWANHANALQLDLNVQQQVTVEIRKILQQMQLTPAPKA